MIRLLTIKACLLFSPFLYGQQKLLTSLLGSSTGSLSSEQYIKFNFQEHKKGEITRYNIALFETANSPSGGTLEFWGHGSRIFSILGPDTIHLEGPKIKEFITLAWDNYEFFQKNIRVKAVTWEHADSFVLPDESIVFSSYMNNSTPEYAFWVKGSKYTIPEKSFLLLIAKIKDYFGLVTSK